MKIAELFKMNKGHDIELDVDIYPCGEGDMKFAVWISHNNSSGVIYEVDDIKDLTNHIKDYLETQFTEDQPEELTM